MKEITSLLGGRFRYNEDIKALQDSALAMTEFLKQIGGNFVLSGCKNNGDGYVWIDGKIRYVEASSTAYNYIIAEDSEGINIDYLNKQSHNMNMSYGAKYSSSASTSAKTISKRSDLGDFPRIGYMLFHNYFIDKATTMKSVVNAPTSFSDTLEASQFTLYVGDLKVKLVIEYPNFVVKFQFNGSEYSLKFPFEKNTVHFTGNGKEWSASSKNENENNSGELFFDSVNSSSHTEIRNRLECDDVLTKTNNGSYVSIKDILSSVNGQTSASKSYPVNTKTNSNIDTMQIIKIGNVVTIQGLLPIEYLYGSTSSSCHEGDPFITSNLQSTSNNWHISCSIKSNSNISYMDIKTSLRLPSSALYPNQNRQPGVILCSDAIEYYSGATTLNGNIQLTIDNEGYFHLLAASTQNNVNILQFVLLNSYTDDTHSTSKLGISFNLTYMT